MLGCARSDLWPFAAQRVKVFPERLDVLRRVVIDRLPVLLRLGNDAIIDVGEIHYLRDPQAFELEIAANHIGGNRGAKVSDVAIVPDRRAAVIKLRFAFDHRAKLFKLSRECVVDAEHWMRV